MRHTGVRKGIYEKKSKIPACRCLPVRQGRQGKIQNQKLKLTVIMGGPSSEKEISLESGRHIYNSLDRNKYVVTPVFMDDQNRFWQIGEHLLWMNTTMDIRGALRKSGRRLKYEDLKKFDFVFLGLHGKYGEDCIFGLLEFLDVPYNGSGVLGGALGMDKAYQRKVLVANGLKVPRHVVVDLNEWTQYKKSKIKYKQSLFSRQLENQQYISKIKNKIGEMPWVVKPSREGCSVALSVVKDDKGLDEAFKEAFIWDNKILVEENLSNFMEVTTTVLGNDEPYALVPTETPKKGEFLTVEEKFLPGDAQMITPPRLPKAAIKKIQERCVAAYKALKLKVYSRIDGFWNGKDLIILEPNALPGLTPSTCVFHQAAEAGLTPSAFLDKIIEYSLEVHKNKLGPL